MKRTGIAVNAAIWFGAAVSVAEIAAGHSCGGNIPAILLGHLLGGVLLFGAGLIGARSGENAMETTREAFGLGGSRFFAALNLLQLVGWTAVMVSQGAKAVTALSGAKAAWITVGLAALVAVWLFVGLEENSRLPLVAMVLLAGLSAVLTIKMAGMERTHAGSAGFWQVFEASVAMPLSWLPLISDYTRKAERPLGCTLASVVTYTAVSCWMYVLGVMLSQGGLSGLADGVMKCGLGSVGLAVVVVSTMTSTFLDAYSAGESTRAMGAKVSQKAVGLVVCAVGAALALSGFVERYIDFLYLIASVFAPMSAVLLTNRYLVRKSSNRWNFVAWIAGMLTYHLAGWSPIGSTLTAISVSAVATLLVAAVASPR